MSSYIIVRQASIAISIASSEIYDVTEEVRQWMADGKIIRALISGTDARLINLGLVSSVTVSDARPDDLPMVEVQTIDQLDVV